MNNIESLLENLQSVLFPETGESGVIAFTNYIIQYSYILASILMVILVGTKIATYFANPIKEIDPYILTRPILILMALSLYQPLVKYLLTTPVDLITDIVEGAAVHATNTSDTNEFNTIYTRQLTSNFTSAFTEFDSEKPMSGLSEILSFSTIFEVLHILIYFVSLGVAGYILVRQVLLKILYYILGVLVLPLSLIPGNDEILKKWFFGFLSVLLWVPILRIAQTILFFMNEIASERVKLFDEDLLQSLFSVILQIVMIFFILAVPKYANMLVSGSGDNDGSGWMSFAGRETYYWLRSRNSRDNNRRINQ